MGESKVTKIGPEIKRMAGNQVGQDQKKKANECLDALFQVAGLAPVNKQTHVVCEQARTFLLEYIESTIESDE
ncbi:MAG TPA: hypothetical protein VMZ92_14200 [Planctomycetota bacterium]|nr:hypothetical protein [Planctomycetota bacterium]